LFIAFATKLGITYSMRITEETPILSLINFAGKKVIFRRCLPVNQLDFVRWLFSLWLFSIDAKR